MLKNSALAQENFISGSLKLDELRMEQREAQEILNVLTVIQKLIEKDDLNIKSYELLQLTTLSSTMLSFAVFLE